MNLCILNWFEIQFHNVKKNSQIGNNVIPPPRIDR